MPPRSPSTAANAASAARPLLLVLPPAAAAAAGLEPLCAAALESGWSGFVAGDGVAAAEGWAVGRAAKPQGLALLGIGMIVGGLLAWIVAATSVMLPYDIAYLGAAPEELVRANPRLLQFMTHDRITLAGTMISIGIQYYMLGKYGLRRELHWAKTALLVSGLVGFSSFFLYLGYGYFDPLHALAAAMLLPMFLLAMRGRADRPVAMEPGLSNDRAWHAAMRGQFAFVALGFALAVGGIVISLVGVTRVFVPEDLAYLCTTPDALRQLNERLLPLIAHDRAGFGGALLSDAIALLATSLWGVQRGERWLWRMLLLAGLPGFIAGFSVHARIGYTDFIHLLPAYAVFLLFLLGLIGLYPYLHADTDKK